MRDLKWIKKLIITNLPDCQQTTNEPGVLALIIVTSICCFVSIAGSVVTLIQWTRSSITKISSILHLLLTVADVLTGSF